MTNTTAAALATVSLLNWRTPELLADASAWAAKCNAVEIIARRGEQLTNATLRAFCVEAVAFLGDAAGTRKLCEGYRMVIKALA